MFSFAALFILIPLKILRNTQENSFQNLNQLRAYLQGKSMGIDSCYSLLTNFMLVLTFVLLLTGWWLQ